MQDLGEVIGEFLRESRESLDQIDRDLLELEQSPDPQDLLRRIFRGMHTIKGTSGFLAFGRLEKLTRAGESLLTRLRDGAQPVTAETVAALVALAGGVRTLLATIEDSGEEGDTDVDGIVVALQAQTAVPPEQAAPPTPVSPDEQRPAPEPVEGQRRPLGELLVESGAAEPADVGSALQQQLEGDHRKLGTILLEGGKAAPAAVTEALQAQTPERGAASAIEVDVELLDRLMNLVGELVLARNQLLRGVQETGDTALVRSAQRLGLIAGELQENIVKTRMQPIGQIWSTLPRVVRELSAALGKQVRLVLEGQETELDRSLLEAVREPLTQLVRNAVEHGIQAPPVRLAAGQPAEGTLTLRAYHEGGQVAVEVADNGAGLAVDELAAMVKADLDRIGGTVSVDSPPGQGTVWRLTIPLTQAVIQALTVDCGDQRYVVPQAAVLDLVFIDGESTKIEYAAGAPFYRLRGQPLPLVRLDRALGLGVGGDHGVYIMVLQADGRRFGLVVDRLLSQEEVVVKAINTRFEDLGRYAGATILSDGKVGLILDVAALARRSHLAPEADRSPGRSRPPVPGTGRRVLITTVGERRVAIPLDAAARLEEFPRSRIERSGSRDVVNHRGRILPLVRLSQLLGADDEAPESDTVAVVVYSDGGRSVALVVDRIVDIAESSPAGRRDAEEDPAVLGQRMTELLDVRRAILAADPDSSAESAESLVEA